MQTRLEAATEAFHHQEQSTHETSVQASAAYLVLQLREDFTHSEEHDLTEAEHQFINSGALEKLDPKKKIVPAAWDSTYKNLSGIFAMLRVIFTQSFFNPEEYPVICENLKKLIAMKKDHWSTKKYFENNAEKTITPSMGEVINLTCHGLLNDDAFEKGTQSLEKNRSHRAYSLYKLLLEVEDNCSTGLSNSFLFLLNGYKNIYIVEIVLSFLHNLTLEFIAEKLQEEFKNNPEALYQFILSKFDIDGDLYESWLDAHKSEIEAYLTEHAAKNKLDPQESSRAINDIVGALSDLDIPNDLNPVIISSLKIIFQTTQSTQAPVVQTAMRAMKAHLTSAPSLEAIPKEPLADFCDAIKISQQCEQYNHRQYFLIGEEGGHLKEAVRVMQDVLTAYFHYISQGKFDYQDLILTKNMLEAINTLKTAIQTYEAQSNEPFVSNFFVLIKKQAHEPLRLLFAKMETYRDRLILSDADIDAYYYRNLNIALNEITISPFEMNRFILHALWLNPAEWSPTFRLAFERILVWFKEKNDRNTLEKNFKSAYFYRHLIENLSLLFLLTSEEAPEVTRQAFERHYAHNTRLETNYTNITNENAIYCRYRIHLQTQREYVFRNEFIGKLALYCFPSTTIGFALLEIPPINAMQRSIVINFILHGYLEGTFARPFCPLNSLMTLLNLTHKQPKEEAMVRAFIREHASMIVDAEDYKSMFFLLEFAVLDRSNQEFIFSILPETNNLTNLFALKDFYRNDLAKQAVVIDKIRQLGSQAGSLTPFQLNALWGRYSAGSVTALEEMLTLLKTSISSIFTADEHTLIRWVSHHVISYNTVFYKVIIHGNLTQFIKSSSGLNGLMNANKYFKGLIEEDIFTELQKPDEENDSFAWDFKLTYGMLSKAGKEKLLIGVETGQFGCKFAFSATEICRLLSTHQTVEQTDFFLKNRSPRWTQVLIQGMVTHYQPKQQPKTDVENYSAHHLLSLYFHAATKTDSVMTIDGIDNIYFRTLIMLIYHFKGNFFLSDNQLDQLMHAPMNEHDITHVIMYALLYPLNEWSPRFKAAFALVIEMLEKNLNMPEENTLNLPLSYPHFIHNLRALFSLARLCEDFPVKLSEACVLFNANTSLDFIKYNPFTSNYVVKILRLRIHDISTDDLALFRVALINKLGDTLALHVQSTEDVFSLLSLDDLNKENYRHIYDVGLQLLIEGKLTIDPVHFSLRTPKTMPGSTYSVHLKMNFSIAISKHVTAQLSQPKQIPQHSARFFNQETKAPLDDVYADILFQMLS